MDVTYYTNKHRYKTLYQRYKTLYQKGGNKLDLNTKNYDDGLFRFEYRDIKYKLDYVHPQLEQMREEIITQIQKKFRSIVLDHIDERLIKGKKDANTVLDVMLSRFIMNQLSTQTIDPVIPSHITDFESIHNDLMTKLNKDSSIDVQNKKEIIDKIIKEFNLNYMLKNAHTKLNNFILESDINPPITKSIDGNYVVLSYGGSKIRILDKLYNKLKDKCVHKDKRILIWCLIKRYKYLKSYNQQLAVHPKTMEKMAHLGVGFELFGSALNTYFDKYCSLFYDIEKHFGSYGSLNFFKPIKGNYTMNPPFDEFIIENSMRHIIESLDQTKDKLRFFVWMPIWDKKGIEYINDKCNNDFKIDSSIYNEYKGYELIKNSPYTKCKKKICLKDMSYWDYTIFKEKKATNTYMIVVDNFDINENACDLIL